MNPLPKETKVAIARSYFAGTACTELAQEFGIAPAHVLMIAQRQDQDRYRKLVDQRKRAMAIPAGAPKRVDGAPRIVDSVLWIDADAARLAQLIPEDTRTLTGRFCGDPLPGRSALDRRQA
jgi:transposase-like protein